MTLARQTLSEQLQISEIEISRRKELLGFVDADAILLSSCKGLVTEHIDGIVAEFYEKQIAIEEIALVIGDADTLQRLHSAQRSYVLSLFDGFYDLDYVDNRLRIGVVHKRMGVAPKLYLSAMKTLRDIVSNALDNFIDDKAHWRLVVNALDKIIYFDTTLVVDTYIHGLLSEVEAAKGKVLSYASELEAKVAERTRQLLELSQHDTLTGLYNRRSLSDFMRRGLHIAKRHKRVFALAYFDIDHFKQINDTKGHFAGDEVLRIVGDSMQKVCRDIDFACRYGGDEFCLVLPDCSLDDAKLICQRLIDQFKTRVPDASLSIGIVQTGPVDFLEYDELIRQADAKMYEAKTVSGFKICW